MKVYLHQTMVVAIAVPVVVAPATSVRGVHGLDLTYSVQRHVVGYSHEVVMVVMVEKQ